MICCRKSFVRISGTPLTIIFCLFNMMTSCGDAYSRIFVCLNIAFGIENHHNLDRGQIVVISFKENLKGKIKLDKLEQSSLIQLESPPNSGGWTKHLTLI